MQSRVMAVTSQACGPDPLGIGTVPAEVGLLHHVLGIGTRAKHPVGDSVQARSMLVEQRAPIVQPLSSARIELGESPRRRRTNGRHVAEQRHGGIAERLAEGDRIVAIFVMRSVIATTPAAIW